MKNILLKVTLSVFCLLLISKINAQNGTKQFEFDDFFKNYTFYSPGIRGFKSMKDGGNYAASESRGTKIVIHSYETGEIVKVILDLAQIKNDSISNFSDFSFDASETKLLLLANKESIYRRSFTANYFVFDIEKQTITQVSKNGKQQLATFSPDGSMVAFVRQNNLFYANLQTGKETQITTDGKFNYVINGVPDDLKIGL